MASASSLELVLGEGVQQGASDCDAASGNAQSCDWGLEHDHGGNNDNNPLHGVADGVGHWIQLAKCLECNLIVHVVGESCVEHVQQELCASLGISSLETGDHGGGALNSEGDGNQHDCGHDREDGVSVGAVHVLANLLTHDLLAEHCAACRSEVGSHRSSEGQPCERQLGHASQGNATNDWQECGIDWPCKNLAHEGKVQSGGHDRLRGLHDVAE
mmetsp:Transcript_73945/g.175985  ORF Transcript_73945/g.175985 Transcript_73945/m.175985 type:complete len:215 (-) Transcript_73945:775-1419(-)